MNGQRVDALSVICERGDADRRGRAAVKKLKEETDRHVFDIAVQAANFASSCRFSEVSAISQRVSGRLRDSM